MKGEKRNHKHNNAYQAHNEMYKLSSFFFLGVVKYKKAVLKHKFQRSIFFFFFFTLPWFTF